MISKEAPPDLARPVAERRSTGCPFPLYRLDTWEEAFEGVAAGLTEASADADFSAARQDAWTFLNRVDGLAGQLGFPTAVLVRQVHGVRVYAADGAPTRGFFSPGEADGLVAGCQDVLLLVTVADCVPVYLLEPRSRVIGLLHAGWRGAAAGILERGLEAMVAAYGTAPGDLHLHLGPSICGGCYEVGPEVRSAFGRSEVQGELDLRAELARQAGALGFPRDRMSASSWCTRCDLDRFHSHRGSGESAGRMAAFLGWNRANGSKSGATKGQ